MGSDTGRFSWETSWHRFFNFEVFLIRNCQSCFLVQSHIVETPHIPQNLIWSRGWFFLWIHQKPNLWFPEKRNAFCIRKKLLCLRGCLLQKKKQTTNQKNPHSQTTITKNKPEKPKPIHRQTHTPDSSHWNYFSLPSDYHILQSNSLVVRKEYFLFMKTNPSWRYLIIFYFIKCWMTQAVWWYLWNWLFKFTDWSEWFEMCYRLKSFLIILVKLVSLLNLTTVQ